MDLVLLIILLYRRKQIHSSDSETSINTLELDTDDSMISEIIESDIELSSSSDGNGSKGKKTVKCVYYLFFLLIFFCLIYFKGTVRAAYKKVEIFHTGN